MIDPQKRFEDKSVGLAFRFGKTYMGRTGPARWRFTIGRTQGSGAAMSYLLSAAQLSQLHLAIGTELAAYRRGIETNDEGTG